ncbi:MAG: hypothetical protein QOD84_2970, partial [Acidobacteriaceae bacterium]
MSSIRKTTRGFVRATNACLLFVGMAVAAGHATSTVGAKAESVASGSANEGRTSDPRELFQAGEAALKSGDLEKAEKCFQGVLAIDPRSAGAFANLGVVYMRRRQWPAALEALNKAKKLAPQVAGIRLNIGLVYYRQNNFSAAVEPFTSVVRDVPASLQARYLLGLCYFFTQRYAEAAAELEPLWPQESDQLNYLYVLGIAADEAHQAELSQRALAKLVAIGQNSATFHLLMGKAHINREEYDDAIREL